MNHKTCRGRHHRALEQFVLMVMHYCEQPFFSRVLLAFSSHYEACMLTFAHKRPSLYFSARTESHHSLKQMSVCSIYCDFVSPEAPVWFRQQAPMLARKPLDFFQSTAVTFSPCHSRHPGRDAARSHTARWKPADSQTGTRIKIRQVHPHAAACVILIERRCGAGGSTAALVSSAFAWEAAPSTSLLTCKSYGNCYASVLSLCTLSLPVSLPLPLRGCNQRTEEEQLRRQQQQGEMQRAQRSSNGATLSPPVSFSFYHLPYPYSHPIPLSVSMPVSLSPCLAPEHKDKAEWRRTVPSYNQSAGAMDLRVWNTQDESQEPLPKNWEMAYTETGMVYFIE